jgi:hypothetical protein
MFSPLFCLIRQHRALERRAAVMILAAKVLECSMAGSLQIPFM